MRACYGSILLLLLGGGGAASAQSSTAYDPFERTNRGLFELHQQIDRTVVRPVAQGYKAVTPPPVRNGLRNVLNNLGEPVTFINDLLQGRPVRAAETATRFVANTTIGVLGVFDVATAAGVPAHDEDFGQTLATYGVGPGPYLFVPVVGPTNARDLGGQLVDIAMNPVNAIALENGAAVRSGAAVLNGVDARARAEPELQRVQGAATDPYATYRSIYAQTREGRIANGATDVGALPDFDN